MTTFLEKANANIAQIQQQLASVTKADTDFDISLLRKNIFVNFAFWALRYKISIESPHAH